jgi:hypothetical protein
MNNSIKSALFSALILTALPSNGRVCQESSNQSTLTSQFTQNGDGTVTDNETALTWMRCSLGQTWDADDSSCNGDTKLYDWRLALIAASDTGFAGQNDWRLPNIKELKSIAEQACYDPAINVIIFPNTPIAYSSRYDYWSSSPYASYDGGAWIVDFYEGLDSIGDVDYPHYVRLVRGGQ